MARNSQLCFLAVFASLFCVISACYEDDLYVIGPTAYQGLVLDGSDSSSIKLQYFTNSSAQLWKFQKGRKATVFYIINNRSGKVLDFEPRGQIVQFMVAKDRRNARRQQWNLRLDGRIANIQNRRNIDVRGGVFEQETNLILVEDNGSQAQEFVLTKVQDFDYENWKEEN